MPPVIAAVGIGVAAGVAAGGASITVLGLGVLGSALLIGTAAGALAMGVYTFASGSMTPEVPTLGTQTAQRAREQTITTDLPARSRRILYGESKYGAIITYKTVKEIDGVRYFYVMAVWGDGPCEQILSLSINGKQLNLNPVTAEDSDLFVKNGISYVRAESKTGSSTQSALASWVSELDDWTSDHRGLGVCYTAFRFRKDTDPSDNLFPNGIQEIQAVIKGRNDIYDPRTETTGYTANNVLCAMHYLTLPKWGVGADYATEIDETQLIASANVCDEDVDLNGGGTEKRYECNGAITLSDTPEDILGIFVLNMAGYIGYVGGKFVLQAGYYIQPDPSYTLDAGKLVSSLQLRTKAQRREKFNTVQGIFLGPDGNYQPTDFPPYQNATYLAEDGGEVLPLDLELPLCASHTQAQRIAKIKLERIRQAKTVSGIADVSLFRNRAFSTVTFDSGRHPAFDDGAYRIESLGFAINQDSSLSVSFTLRETASEIYDWDETTDEQPFAPSTITTAALAGDAPSNFTATPSSDFVTLTNGTVTASMTLAWDADETVSRFELYQKLSSSSDYVLIATLAGTQSGFAAVGLSQNTNYDYQLKSYIQGIENGQTVVLLAGTSTLTNQPTAAWDGGVTLPQVATPTFTDPAGEYDSGDYPKSITIATATSGATIRYSKSAMPNSETEGTEYTAAVSVDADDTLYAKAFKSGLQASNGTSGTYTAS